MAKDVKKAQDKNINKNETKKQQKNVVTKEKKEVVAEKVETKIQPKKEFSKSKKVIEQEVIENKKEDNKITKKEKKEKNKKKLVSAVKVLDDNRKAILCCIIGFLVATLLFRCVLWPDRIATLSDGTQPVATLNGEPVDKRHGGGDGADGEGGVNGLYNQQAACKIDEQGTHLREHTHHHAEPLAAALFFEGKLGDLLVYVHKALILGLFPGEELDQQGA